MANRTFQRLIVLSRAGCSALAIAAVAVAVPVPTKHKLRVSDMADGLMALALGLQTVVWPFLLGLVHIERMGLVGEPPGNVVVAVLAVGEWVLACFTSGTACAGLAVVQTTISRRVCAPTACAMYLSENLNDQNYTKSLEKKTEVQNKNQRKFTVQIFESSEALAVTSCRKVPLIVNQFICVHQCICASTKVQPVPSSSVRQFEYNKHTQFSLIPFLALLCLTL